MATIVSVASGKGGVGNSVTVSNLGLTAAQRGLRVVLADLDVGGADLHVLFGQFDPTGTLTDFLTRRVNTLDGILQDVPLCPRLRLLPGTGNTRCNGQPDVRSEKTAGTGAS